MCVCIEFEHNTVKIRQSQFVVWLIPGSVYDNNNIPSHSISFHSLRRRKRTKREKTWCTWGIGYISSFIEYTTSIPMCYVHRSDTILNVSINFVQKALDNFFPLNTYNNIRNGKVSKQIYVKLPELNSNHSEKCMPANLLDEENGKKYTKE